LKRNVVIDNRPGAGGMIAAQALKASPPDENTVLLVNDHMVAMIPWTMKNPGYDAVRDFASLGQVAKFNLALGVSSGAGINSAAEYLARAKSDKLVAVYGVPAPASTFQFAGYVLAKSGAVDLVPVPYKGSAPLVADLLGSQIPAGISTVTDMVEGHRAGKLKVLAVAGKARSGLLPDVPTFAELGYKGLDRDSFIGFYAPGGTSPKFIAQFTEALRVVMAQQEVRGRFMKLGFEPAYATPKTFSDSVAADTEYWGTVVKGSGFQP
jgi:tripartite-type tricarboxylate transporter receptor subunit TctC